MLTATLLAAFPSGIAGIAIWLIIVAGIVTIAFIALRELKVTIPGWVISIFWVLVVCIVCIAAIKFLIMNV